MVYKDDKAWRIARWKKFPINRKNSAVYRELFVS